MKKASRIDLINALIQRFKYKKYLEIGTQKNVSLTGVKCAYKVGVDPDPLELPNKTMCNKFYKLTSDEFFKQNKETFDIVFIDGLHESQQVYKDIYNAVNFLNKGGTIVMHDINPTSEEMQRVPRETRVWTGDCWKAFVKVRSEIRGFRMFTVDVCTGCGVMREGQDNFHTTEELNYNWLMKNRNTALNLISWNQFLLWLKS